MAAAKIFAKRKILALILVVLVIVAILTFFIPLRSYKGVNRAVSPLAVTCQGYLTSDGLPPGVDEYRKFHILSGGLAHYRDFKKQIAPTSCVGGLKTVKAELFL